MIFVENMLIFLPVLFYLIMTGIVLLWLRRKNHIAGSAPRGCRVSRVAETVIFSCGAVIAGIYAAHLTERHYNIFLNLDQLRPAYAATHLILAGIVCTILLASLALCILGRTSLAVVISVTLLTGYGTLLSQCKDNRVPYLMTLIAPEGSWEPIINYTFQFENDPNRQGDLWINDVYLGKMPLTVSGQELYGKVPQLDKETEKLYRQKAHRDREMCQINMVTHKARDYPGALWYTTKFEEYFAKVEIGETLHKPFGYGQWNSDSGGPRYDYVVTIPDTLEAHRNRFDKFDRIGALLQKARLNNYKVDDEWKAALLSYDDYGWRELRKSAELDEGFETLVDQWVIDEYGIGQNEPQQIFKQICEEATTKKQFRTGFLHGRAIEMIYDKLDYKPLVGIYETAIKSGRHLDSGGHTWLELTERKYIKYNHRPNEHLRGEVFPASFSVIRHVLKLWDKKLNAENPYKDNLIEEKITPAMLVYRYDLDQAKAFGGSVYERYLLRQWYRHHRVEGIELGHENYEFEGGMHLNKWLYHLVRLDTPGGREFRKRYFNATREMAELLTNGSHNHAKNPPDFLFYDLDRGRQSLAVRFWEEYLVIVEDSSPPWQPDKLEKRLKYLKRLGSLATDEMYRQCWQYVDLKKVHDIKIVKALEVLSAERKIFMAKLMLESIESNKNVSNRQVIVRDLRTLLEREHD